MNTVVRKTWRELSEAAAREQDPEKLLELVEQLNKALEEQEEQTKKQHAMLPGCVSTSRVLSAGM
jgi:sulfur transfer protein SufE